MTSPGTSFHPDTPHIGSTEDNKRERAQAVRTIGHYAHNADDAALLLDMLGLDPREGQ